MGASSATRPGRRSSRRGNTRPRPGRARIPADAGRNSFSHARAGAATLGHAQAGPGRARIPASARLRRGTSARGRHRRDRDVTRPGHGTWCTRDRTRGRTRGPREAFRPCVDADCPRRTRWTCHGRRQARPFGGAGGHVHVSMLICPCRFVRGIPDGRDAYSMDVTRP